MMLKKDGVAALFDSMVFLAVVALVSVVLLTSSIPRAELPDGKGSELDAVHETLLRCTVRSDGNPLPLLEAVVQGGQLTEPIKQQITVTLEGLLPGKGWRWTISSSAGADHLGGDVPTGEDVFASVEKVPLPSGEVTFMLEAWSR